MRIWIAAVSLMTAAVAPAGARAPSLDKALAGRTAGRPVECIDQHRIDDSEIFDSGSILYRMRGGPDYLNTPSPRCTALRSDRAIMTRTPSTSLCRGDIAEIFDPVSHMNYGACGLGAFVPYAKPRRQ